MAVQELSSASDEPKVALFNDPKVINTIFQVVLILVIGYALYSMWDNATINLQKQGIAGGYGFLNNEAGFAINFSPVINYSVTSNYGTVFWVGLQNTLVLAVIGIILATILGFTLGVARLSSNWIISRMAYVYVEVLRNIPLLLQIFIWYKGVLALLPTAKNSIERGFMGVLNVKAWLGPKPVLAEGAGYVGIAILAAIVISILVAKWSKNRQMATGQRFPVFWTTLGLLILLPLIVYFIMGQPLSFEYAKVGRFGPRGGMAVPPEFTALLLALTTYTATFIAEIVRAGILAVNQGQTEASYALGLRPGQTLRLNIIPQAMRVIIPPLTSQYLNLTKNSSLAVAIAFPDLTSVFAGTALNQTGQAVEILFITMITYLIISIITAMFMNWYNAKMSLVER